MNTVKIAVIGLGYVGLPLARLFSTKFPTIGFDLNQHRVDSLNNGHDATLEVDDCLLQDAINNNGFRCTTCLDDIRDCNFYVVAVPTPVDENNRPDLRPLWGASETVGKVISKGDIVVYESTVYPGVTEEECLPVVEKISGLKFNEDFFAGYSPERINPGDKVLSLVIGNFGQRWAKIAKALGADVETIEVEPGNAINPLVLKETGGIESLVQGATAFMGHSKMLAATIMLAIGLFITMGIGTSFGTIPILAVLFVPICAKMGFSVPATVIILSAAAALGDAGSPASDTTLGPTAGLNADGQHNHITDTCIPTFVHYNVPLIVFAVLAVFLF